MSIKSNESDALQEILVKKSETLHFWQRVVNKLNSYRMVIKVLFLVVLTTTMTIALISSYFFLVTRPNQITSELVQLEQHLDFLGDSFEQEINSSRADILFFTESSLFKQLISAPNGENFTSLLNLTRTEFLDLAKNLDHLLEVSYMNETLYELIEIERDVVNNVLVLKSIEKAPPLFQPIFNRVKNLSRGTIYTSNIQLDREDRVYPAIIFATPVYNQSNDFVGVVAVTFYLQPIFDQIAEKLKMMTSPDVELAMLDRSGIYLFNTVEPRWTAPGDGGDGTNLFIENDDVPRDFFEKKKGYVLIGNELMATGYYLVQSRLDLEFTDEYFEVHLMATVPTRVLVAAINQQVQVTIGFVLVAGVLAALFTIVAATYGLIRPLNALTTLTTRLARGDLGVSVEPTLRQDELGELQNSFYLMVKSLRELVGTIVESNELVTSSSENVSAQAEEVTAAAEEVAASVQNVTRGASSQAEKISTIIEHLNELETVVTKVIKEIQSSARQINELAQLTRILSLNATIEASRAGTDARGFMVIAENVQKLAQESRDAATHINSVVKTINERMSATLETVTESMEEVASVSEETAALAEEVSASVAEVIGAMEEMTALSQSLSEQATKAAEVVSKFKMSSGS